MKEFLKKFWNKYLLITFAILLIVGAIITIIVTKHNGTF